MKRWVPCFLLLAATAARAGGNGTTAAESLDLPVSARATAMGIWGVSGVMGAGSLSSNPGALARLRAPSLLLSHVSFLESATFSHAAFAGPWGKKAGWGIGLRHFSAGAVETTDALGLTGGSLTPSDSAVSAGVAYRTPIGSFGAAGKYIQSKVVDSAETFSGDAGYLSPPLLAKRFQVGLAATNIFGDLDFGNGPEALPRVWRAGASFEVTPAWTLAGEFSAPKAGENYGGLGTEFRHEFGEWSTAVRAGYSNRATDTGGTSGFSVGLGLGRSSFIVDYAFVPLGDLGATHWFTFALRFASPAAKSPAAKPPTSKPSSSPTAQPKRLSIKDKR